MSFKCALFAAILFVMVPNLVAAKSVEEPYEPEGNTIGVNSAPAWALASLIAPYSNLTSEQKKVLRLFGDGKQAEFSTFEFKAKMVRCEAGLSDLSAHICDISFGEHTTQLRGRLAHELFATFLEGLTGEGAASDKGKEFIEAKNLWCLVSKTTQGPLKPYALCEWEEFTYPVTGSVPKASPVLKSP